MSSLKDPLYQSLIDLDTDRENWHALDKISYVRSFSGVSEI